MNRVTTRDGTSIAYDVKGSGQSIILVDGAFCARTFGPLPQLADALAGHFRVFHYDRRGRGDSTDASNYQVEREVDDLAALIKVAGGQAHLFGQSSGGALALRAAAAGLPVLSVAAYEPPFMIGTKGHRPPPTHREDLQRLVAEGRTGAAATYFMTKVVGMPRIAAFPIQLSPMWGKLKRLARTLPYDAAIMGDYEIPDAIVRRVPVPVLIGSGERSPAVLRASAAALAARLPHGTHHSFPKQSHAVSIPYLAAVITPFFQNERQKEAHHV